MFMREEGLRHLKHVSDRHPALDTDRRNVIFKVRNMEQRSRIRLGVSFVPSWVVGTSVLALLVSISMMLVGAVTGGITWDEEVHVIFLETFLRYGWNVDSAGIVDGVPDPQLTWGIYVYGPVANLLAHLANVVVGIDEWGQVASSPLSFVGQHVVTVGFGILGIVSVGLIVRFVTRSWRWTLLGTAIGGSIPLWVGHSMFNIKDIPVASGYTLATAGVTALVTTASSRDRSRLLLAWICLIGGTVLAAGTRMASGVPIALGVIGTASLMAFYPVLRREFRGSDRFRPALRVLGNGAAALTVSYLVLLALYPRAFRNPVLLGYEALFVSARFPFDESVMTNGVWMEQPVNASYLPQWFGAQLPILVLLGGGGFVIWWGLSVIRPRAMRENVKKRKLVLGTTPIMLQALGLPIGAIVLGSNIYNGTRQFLFVVPALAVMTTLSIYLVAQRLDLRNTKTWLSISFWGTVVVLILGPIAGQATLLPYNYVYYNLPTTIAGVDSRWPTDYWRQSARELVQLLPATGMESCAYEQYRKDELFPCMGIPTFSTYAEERGSKADSADVDRSTYYYVRENQGNLTLPRGCSPYATITRRLYFTTITIGEIARCPLSLVEEAFDSPAE